jgi:hypothetical protein
MKRTKNSGNHYVLPLMAVILFAFLFADAAKVVMPKNKPGMFKNAPGNKVVIMELFTSQGCSSCPPADAILSEYAAKHDSHIIPLSFHVDYWNRLGWADPFSSSIYSSRQQWYSQHLPGGSVYTPQLIVNGRGEAVGNNRNAVNRLVQNQLTGNQVQEISLQDVSVGKTTVSFHYTAKNTGNDDVLNIALVEKEATTHIRAGENNGVTLTNHNIVRSFSSQPVAGSAAVEITIPPAFNAAQYVLVVYVQNKKDLSISTGVLKDLLP